MVTVGVDVHKDTHTAVMVDEVGRELAQRTVRATNAGHRELVRWARREAGVEALRFAVEDCQHVSTRLERDLLAADLHVVRVPPKLMAGARSSARTRGKSDPIDALAIARAALREPNLPVAAHDPVSREIKLLVDHREDLVNQRTQIQNRLRWHLHGLDPELDPTPRSLAQINTLQSLREFLAAQSDSLVVRIAAELVEDIAALTLRANAIERELTARVGSACPQLLEIDGCGVLTAAKILGETANITRFRSEACFAMHSGVAPIPASSGRTNRHRLARGGNRQLNAALHRIAVTQIRTGRAGHDYYQRRKAMGNTTMEALRALKRRLARIVYTSMNTTLQAAPQPQRLPAA